MHIAGILVVALFAQVGAATQPRTASVQGLVVTLATNDPIPNAAVELRSIDAGPARIYTFTTGADGRFTFRNVPAGTYQLTAIRGGYVRGDFGLRGPGASGITITLAAAQQMVGVRFGMKATGTISGRITDLLGEGVGNVHVKALRFSYQNGRPALIDVKSVFTDDLGEYRLGWLPPGLYNVSALHPDASTNPLNLPEVINSATIVGTAVTNAGGMNGGGFAASGNGDPAVRARLGMAQGEDHVPVYFPGTFDQRSASVIDVRSGVETNGVDMIVTPVRTASISGEVIDGMGRASLAAAGVSPRPQLQVARNPSYNLRTTNVAIDARTGAFSIAGLAPGSYVFAAALGNGDDRVTGHAVVDVGEGAVENVRVVLEQGVRIPARVVVDGLSSVVRVSNLRVSLRTDPLVPGIAETAATTPAADGSLTLPPVVPGDYVVNVTPLMTLSRASATSPPPAVPGPSSGFGPALPAATSVLQGAYVKSIRLGDTDVLNGRLRVDGRPAGQPLEIVVGTNAGQIEGAAIDGRRRPAANATVVLIPERDKRHRLDLYRTATTDTAGRFRMSNVPPDDYSIFAWDDVETGAWLDSQFLRAHEGRGQPLRIGEGVRIAVDVAVIPLR